MKNLAAYTNHFRDEENVYYLNKKGRELVGSSKAVQKSPNYLHTIMRNDVYIHFNCPKLWKNEFPIPNQGLVPDAVYSVNGQQYFLEVDRLQKMNKNIEKLKRYASFRESGLWQKHNGGQFPIVVFYTTTDTRKWQLTESNPGLSLLCLTKKDLN